MCAFALPHHPQCGYLSSAVHTSAGSRPVASVSRKCGADRLLCLPSLLQLADLLFLPKASCCCPPLGGCLGTSGCGSCCSVELTLPSYKETTDSAKVNMFLPSVTFKLFTMKFIFKRVSVKFLMGFLNYENINIFGILIKQDL